MINRAGRKYSRREKMAGYFYNLSQLTFAALVLGGAALYFNGGEFTPRLAVMLAVGCFVAASLAGMANSLLK